MTRLSVFALTAAALLIPNPAPAQRPTDFRAFDTYAAQAMALWKVPGVAIAIVRNDSIIHIRGYGVRQLGGTEPVDAQTLFAIGSSSKAFTATSLAMLVDEGKVRWDDKATLHLPGFQLYDSYATRDLTIRDLLSHRSGLSRGDLMWYGSSYSRDEILRRVRFLEPSWGFRERFGYQNLMYLAAGQVAARASGMSWDDFVRTRIFQPLGMTSSSTSIRDLAGRPNVAQPHAEIDDTVRTVPYRNIDNIGPAGSINSNVTDMAQWVRFNLARGKAGGKQLVSDGNMGELWSAHTAMRVEGPNRILFPDVHLMSYGLGWFLQDYRGRLVVQHGGNIDGMTALVAMMPEENLGMVILSNMNGSALPSVLMYRAFDVLLGGATKDLGAVIRTASETSMKQAKQADSTLKASRKTGTSPTLAAAEYVGTYVDSLYGTFEVTQGEGGLRARYGQAFAGKLDHWHYDTFQAVWDNRMSGKTMVQFVLGTDGKVAEARVQGFADFTKKPAAADTTPGVALDAAAKGRLVGTYRAEGLPVEVQVQMVGDDLKLSVPGQPPYTLIAESPTRFRMTLPGAEMPGGFFVEFVLAGGQVTEMTLIQPAPRPSLKMKPVR
jgi:CubicO group peptidase (beta-lactamase class C family)